MTTDDTQLVEAMARAAYYTLPEYGLMGLIDWEYLPSSERVQHTNRAIASLAALRETRVDVPRELIESILQWGVFSTGYNAVDATKNNTDRLKALILQRTGDGHA